MNAEPSGIIKSKGTI